MVPANCARVDENAAAAEVGSTDELIATNKRNVSSPASKFASDNKNDDQFKAFGDGLISGGSGPGGWVGQDNAHGQGMADVSIVGDGNVFGDNIAGNAEVFVAAQDTASTACVLDYSGLCNNVTDRQVPPSAVAIKSVLDSGANDYCASGMEGDGNICASVGGARTYNTKVLKKRKRRLSRNRDCRPGSDMKRTSFDHSAYRAAQGTSILSTNQDSKTPPVARSLSKRGHPPTKAEVKKMNQRLVDENHRLKKDFHKTHHRLKTLLADKKDLLRRLRLESKGTNKLIQSIQDEAQDTMERAHDILSEANRSKKDAEMLKDDIQINQNTLLGMQMGIRKQSAQLKKQAARMTQTHARRNHALLQQQTLIDHNVNTEKQQWNTTLILTQRKMQSSIKQLQKELVMWQVLNQEAELRCEDAQLELHRQKSNGRNQVLQPNKWKKKSEFGWRMDIDVELFENYHDTVDDNVDVDDYMNLNVDDDDSDDDIDSSDSDNGEESVLDYGTDSSDSD